MDTDTLLKVILIGVIIAGTVELVYVSVAYLLHRRELNNDEDYIRQHRLPGAPSTGVRTLFARVQRTRDEGAERDD